MNTFVRVIRRFLGLHDFCYDTRGHDEYEKFRALSGMAEDKLKSKKQELDRILSGRNPATERKPSKR